MTRRRSPAVVSRRPKPLFAESLEPRRLLATLNGGILQIDGTAGVETVTVARDGADLVVTTNGTAQRFAASGVTQIRASLGNGNDSLLIDDAVSTPASLLGEAGDDTLRGGIGNDSIDGGAGDDTVTYAGRTAAITATVTMRVERDFDPDGGPGPAYANGYGTGGASGETDTYAFIDTIVGGSGNDTLTLEGEMRSPPGYPATGPRLRAEGGAGNDSFGINSGLTNVDIVADGGDGNDSFGFSGNRDPVLAVSLYGGAGDDSFGSGTDDGGYGYIDGGAGTDELYFTSIVQKYYTIPDGVENFTHSSSGGNGSYGVTVIGNGLNNVITLDGGATLTTVRGGGGDDTIRVVGNGGSGNNAFYGEAGNDTITGSASDDLIDGGDGLDTVSYAGRTAAITATVTMTVGQDEGEPAVGNGGGTGGVAGEGDTYRFIETIVGGSGNDTLTLLGDSSYRGPGQFILRGEGGAGDDQFVVRGNLNSLPTVQLVADGGDGNDRFDFSENRIDVVPISLYGGSGDDSFYSANDEAEYSLIDGGTGTDLLTFTGPGRVTYSIPEGVENLTLNRTSALSVVGNDLDNVITLNGGAGGTTVRGGDGDDTIVLDDAVTRGASLLGENGNDSIVGGSGADTIEGGDGNDTVQGGDGNDVIRGDAGDDSVMGDGGNDAVNGGDGDDFVGGGAGNDNLAGGDGDDQLAGDTGNDSVRGDDGDDRVAGNAGSDRLKGGRGNDTLLGQNGRDFLQGGTGADYLLGGGNNDVLSVDRGDDGIDTLSGNGGRDDGFFNAGALLSSIEQKHPL